jgi:hypothetical protein
MRPIANTCDSRLPNVTVCGGESCDNRPFLLSVSNARAFAFLTSVNPCLLSSKIAGLALLSRHLCPDAKKRQGRKRHVLVDTQGLLMSVNVLAANITDREGGKVLLICLVRKTPSSPVALG